MADDDGRQLGKLVSLPSAPDAIELRHLRSFVAVADELNFGRAATRLYLSQPALSRQIRALERLVGCDLLRRSTHRVELTLAGEALLDRARRILGDVDNAVSATRSIGGELASRAEQLWEPVRDQSTGGIDIQGMRTAYEALHAQFQPIPEVVVRPVNAGGVPSLLLTPQPERPATMLFLHGGGGVMGSAFGYRPLVGALAAAAEANVVLPEFRLAPEHPFPAGLDDAMCSYLWMLDHGTDPGQVTIAGDSAGAGLALSVLLTLKEQRLPMPGGAVLLCPGIDPTFASLHKQAQHQQSQREPQPLLPLEQMHVLTEMVLGGHPIEDPVVSPLLADLTGLPPMLIHAGTGDAFADDAHRLLDHAKRHGVEARLELYPVATHVFHLFWSFLPEAADALRQAGSFAREVRAASAVKAVKADAAR